MMCEVAIFAPIVAAYDLDVLLNTDKAIGTSMLPINKLLLSFLLASGEFQTIQCSRGTSRAI